MTVTATEDESSGTEGRIEDRLERFSARIDPWMTALAVAWLPILVVPLIKSLNGPTALTFEVLDYLIWGAFGIEYGLKVWLATDRWRFIRGHLLDLAIVAVPLFRPLRLARLFRLLRLGRVVVVLTHGLKRSRAALAQHALSYMVLATTVIVFSAASLELLLEKRSGGPTAIHGFGDALWWAAATVTTVGYGDKVPLTGGGRFIAVGLMLTGIGLVGVLTATVASYLVRQQRADELAALKEQMHEIRQLLAPAPELIEGTRVSAAADRAREPGRHG